MKNTSIIVCIFIAGLIIGSFLKIPDLISIESMKTGIIDALLLLIGIGVGADTEILTHMKKLELSRLVIPFLIAAGSILGSGIVALLLPQIGFKQGLAVGSGLGFYSLSSILLTDLQGIELGTIALLTNLIRELFTILSTPLLVKWFGGLAPIASGGATSMDVTLPFIQRYSGNQYTLLAIFNGVILTILVPILVPIFGS